jgi:cysteinyl-tRNA synthetase
MTEVLGINPLNPQWSSVAGADADDAMTALDALVKVAIEARAAARATHDFKMADRIRDQLSTAGIAVEDTSSGARWSLARRNDV